MNSFKEKIAGMSLFNNSYAMGRTLLALATLITISLNPMSVLSPLPNEESSKNFLPSLFVLGDQIGVDVEITRIFIILLLIPIIIGYYPRIFGLIHWYICYSIYTYITVVDGGDYIATTLTFLLIPLTVLDNRTNHWQPFTQKSLYKNFSFLTFSYLVKIQVMIIYLHAAIGRLKNEEWGEGTALYYFLNHPMLGVPEYQSSLMIPILESNIVVFLTWSVTAFELLLVSAIFWSGKFRKYILVLGILFHLGILITIGIASFAITMWGALVLYLYPLQENIKFKRERIFYAKRQKNIS